MDYVQILNKTKLFAGINLTDIENMLNCFRFKVKSYRKGDYIYQAGEQIKSLAVLCEGSLFMQKDGYWGNRIIINHITAGEVFGGAYALSQSEPLPYDVVAGESSAVLFFDAARILTGCPEGCACHTALIRNLVCSLSQRNGLLMQKIDFMSQRTIRDKLTTYLTAQYSRTGSEEFTIPLNRQQLADYLSVDRSALSNELSKMRDEGMLEFSRNHFVLLRNQHSSS